MQEEEQHISIAKALIAYGRAVEIVNQFLDYDIFRDPRDAKHILNSYETLDEEGKLCMVRDMAYAIDHIREYTYKLSHILEFRE